MERRIERLEREGRPPACVIMEAAMMNLGSCCRGGYLKEVREITARHGVVLIFDEVKTASRSPPAARPSASASRPTW